MQKIFIYRKHALYSAKFKCVKVVGHSIQVLVLLRIFFFTIIGLFSTHSNLLRLRNVLFQKHSSVLCFLQFITCSLLKKNSIFKKICFAASNKIFTSCGKTLLARDFSHFQMICEMSEKTLQVPHGLPCNMNWSVHFA